MPEDGVRSPDLELHVVMSGPPVELGTKFKPCGEHLMFLSPEPSLQPKGLFTSMGSQRFVVLFGEARKHVFRLGVGPWKM